MTTRPIQAFSRRNRTEHARRYGADLAPTIKGVQEAGITSLGGIAAELTRLGVPFAAGSSEWRPAQVAWVLHQLRWRRADELIESEAVQMAEKQTRKKSATLSLRIDDELKDAAEFAAAVDRRSLTAYIETLIENDLRARTAAMPIAPRADTRRRR
jgi:hypothetical protein